MTNQADISVWKTWDGMTTAAAINAIVASQYYGAIRIRRARRKVKGVVNFFDAVVTHMMTPEATTKTSTPTCAKPTG